VKSKSTGLTGFSVLKSTAFFRQILFNLVNPV